MPVIPDEVTSEIFLTTGELPNTHPYLMDSSPDGSKLYVTMAGASAGASGTTDASIIEITVATKAVRTILSGVTYFRSMAVHPTTGDLYYSVAPNGSGAKTALQIWDVDTETSSSHPSIETLGHQAMELDPFEDIIWVKHADNFSNWMLAYNLTTGVQVRLLQIDNFAINRSIAISSSYVLMAESDNGNQYLFNRSTGALIRRPSSLNRNSNGVAAVSDTEFYHLSQWGQLYRYDADADSATALVTGLPVGTIDYSSRGYGDIEITSSERVFVARGGWSADQQHEIDRDETSGTDVGIYELLLGGKWLIDHYIP